MSKIGIVTFHRAINYGAMLQAVAVQRAIKNMGENSELIDYTDKLYDHYKVSYKSSNRLKSILKYFASWKKRLKSKRFEKFLYANSSLSDRKYSKNDIGKIHEEDYKFFFTGSDQVFNPQIVDYDDTYLLGFVKDKNKCCSYAGSIGLSQLNGKEQKWLFKYLKDFRKILIREKTGQKLLEEMEISGSELVCDPTFLLGKAEWESMEHETKIPPHYILKYGFKDNYYMNRCIETLQKKANIPVLVISDVLINRDYAKKNVFLRGGVGPAEWIYLIHHADYIVTNSFHGMIFSFIFNKQVKIADSNDGTFSRMEDFLKEMGCGDCIIGTNVEQSVNTSIDYNTVNPKMEQYIACSKDKLRAILENGESE